MHDLSTPVGMVMRRRWAALEMDDDLWKVRELFQGLRTHHMLVIENEELVGVISDRDLLRALSPYLGSISEQVRDLATLDKRAHHIMTRDVVTITAGRPVREAVRLFIDRDISCLPVTVAGTMRVEGIITRKDVLRWLIAGESGSAASAA